MSIEMPTRYSLLHWTDRRQLREQYIDAQDGLCWYCKRPLVGKPSKSVLSRRINKKLFPKNFFKYPIHLHHDHNTDLTVGAVHNTCNAVLWQYHGE